MTQQTLAKTKQPAPTAKNPAAPLKTAQTAQKETLIQELENIINHSTGTTNYHIYNRLTRNYVCTDSVLSLAQKAKCYWLLDLIASYHHNPKLNPEFQIWTLTLTPKNKRYAAIACGYNDTNELIIRQKIDYTDFPLPTLKLYVTKMDNYQVILLPSEY